jgi:hypothetical protein
MDMNKGIDAQVSDRVDAYRGQPQQLMQMYQQNKELVDLLALQKLKSEKEAAKRQIEMQMQQQPGTVAQQREQEVMQMTKDELAKQTQGVLQRKQQQQQFNMQRAAKGGLDALAQNRPAPAPAPAPTAMMANGGIVAFQEGGSAFGDSAADFSGYGKALSRNNNAENVGAAVRQYYADFGITNQDQWDRTPADAKKRIISAVKAKIGASGVAATLAIPFAELNDLLVDPFKAISNIGIAASNTGLGSALGLSDPRNPNELYQYNTERKRTQDTIAANMTPKGGIRLPPGPTVRSGEYTEEPAPQPLGIPTVRPKPDDGTGIAALPTDPIVPALENPSMAAPATEAEAKATATTAGTSAVQEGIASLGGGSMGGAENALMRGVKIGEDVMGRDEKAAKYAEYEAQLAELDKDLYDPEAERRQQLQAFLIGTAGASNIGYAMAGGAAAAINLENQQKRNQRSRMLSRIQLGERGMTLDSEMGKAALNIGNQMFADFNANKRMAISAGATLEAARLRKVTADADREFEREKQDDNKVLKTRELDIREAETAVQQARNEELSLSRRTEGVLKATNNLLQRSEDVYKMAADRYDLEGASADLSMLNPDDEGYEVARAKFETVSAEADAWATQYLENLGINDRLQELEREYYKLTGVDNMPGLNPDDIVDVQPQGE